MIEHETQDAWIDINDEGQCRRWSERFGVSVQELRAAVREVGPRPADVRLRLAPGEQLPGAPGNSPL